MLQFLPRRLRRDAGAGVRRPVGKIVAEGARMHLPGAGNRLWFQRSYIQSRIVPIVAGWCICSKFTARLLSQVAMVISSSNIY